MTRPLALLALLLLLLLLPPGPSAGAGPVRCTCREGKACYHWLGAPVVAPEDPCSCPFCREFPGKCEKRYPEDWDPVCAGNGKMECFLRRHAASWGIACSERLAGACACRNPHPEACPRCGRDGAIRDAERLKVVERQVAVERRLLGPKGRLVVAESAHFYVVTDVAKLKVRTQERSFRVLETHEIAHLFLQRAEIAWDDFVATFGPGLIVERPIGIYFLDDESVKREVATAYIGLPEPELFYGGDHKSIGGGHGWNCAVYSRQKYVDDVDLHHQMRHLIGHLLISCWKVVGGANEILPRWVYAGAGHWLSRLPRLLSETANFCSGEGTSVRDSGKGWDAKVRAFAANPRSEPMEKILLADSLDALDLEIHIRAWSMFDVFLREDPARFVRFLEQVRRGVDQRTALREALACSPEEFDRRWRDRVLGRRDTVAPTAVELDRADPARPGAGEREAIRAETDPGLLAVRIRALDAVDDPLTAQTLLPLLAHESEVVRETATFVLGRTRDAGVREVLRTQGLGGTGLVRANAARAVARTGDAQAGEALRPALEDGNWLVRAEAAVALGRIRDEPALPGIAKLLDDRVPPVRAAAMDALAAFGAKAGPHAAAVEDHLEDPAWQIRSAAADCLRSLEQTSSVDALIARMGIETGRVRKDIRTALKWITRDDLGDDPERWREFWEKEKARAGGRPERPPPPPDPADHDYGETPTFWGLAVFSESVGYVVDTSTSMSFRIRVDEGWLRRHRRDYPPEDSKYGLAEHEIAASLRSLDPRVRFNLWFFRSVAAEWKGGLVAAAPGSVDSALSRVANEAPRGDTGDRNRQTNYVDVLRLVFGAKAGAPPSPAFADTPDTLYFLTDGKPTVGEITDPDVLLGWVRERNLFARLRLHVITFGTRESRLDFLRALAEDNGGTFVLVPEAQ